MKTPEIAVLIPCFNEAITIAQVIKDFRKVLPTARIYVADNNSTDATAKIAEKEGATVFHEQYQGKGNAVRTLFRQIDADIYIMVDGDSTYDPKKAPEMVSYVQQGIDMVVGIRSSDKDAYPAGHMTGNKIFNCILKLIFNSTFTDIFSGYRGFSRKFVKSFPALSGGFDIETELSIHALDLRCAIKEIPTIYKQRPEGSYSKLSTWQDGFKILWRMGMLYKEMRPFLFFFQISVFLLLTAGVLGYPLITHFLETGLVPRLPTAILSASFVTISFLSLVCGIILESVQQGRREFKRLFYLNA